MTTGTLSDVSARTRVRGINVLLETVSGREGEPSSGTHRGIAYTYGKTASGPSRQYNGRVYDAGTGFHDYGARLYWPEIGRFVSADGYLGDVANPASLNRYSYVHDNPYKYTDPTGHFAFLAALPAICAAGACEAIASAALWTAAAIGVVAVVDVAVHFGRHAPA